MSEKAPTPFEEEDAVVGGNLGDEDIVVDAEAKERAPEPNRMLWEGVDDKPLIDQIAVIGGLARFAFAQFDQMKALIEKGVPGEEGTITLEVTPLETQALSFGLNLVGFFVPEMAEEATTLLNKAVALVNAVEYDEEFNEKLRAAHKALNHEGIAAMLGVTVEELQELRAKEQEIREAEAVAEVEAQIAGPGGEPTLN